MSCRGSMILQHNLILFVTRHWLRFILKKIQSKTNFFKKRTWFTGKLKTNDRKCPFTKTCQKTFAKRYYWRHKNNSNSKLKRIREKLTVNVIRVSIKSLDRWTNSWINLIQILFWRIWLKEVWLRWRKRYWGMGQVGSLDNLLIRYFDGFIYCIFLIFLLLLIDSNRIW